MTSAELTRSRIESRGSDDTATPGSAYLLVVYNDSSSIFPLPHSGNVVLGRGHDVELRLDHSSVSRRHATIRVDEGVVRIADLESHNGTRVNGEVVTGSRALYSGDVATVGDVVCVVHFSEPTAPARSTYGEAGWRRRLAEELDRAIAYKRTLAVIVVLGGDVTPAGLAGALRLIDVVGHTDDGQPLLLLPEADHEDARAIATQILALAPDARLGLAMCPTDACDADTILLVARGAARRASPGSIAEPAEGATRIELGSRQVLIADPAMQRVFALLERLAPSELPVLIYGETGVGKENAAYAVHHWSRRTGPFIAVNCASIAPDGLVESELFGHDKGAFTGATAAKAGLFENAAGGTVFLDELGEMPMAVQAKFLRALESKKITRVGESRERAIDVRIVAATNVELLDAVAAGKFREDLYFRLRGAPVILPPLRDRRCEIPMLARAFLDAECTRQGKPAMSISATTMQLLLTHTWRGNARELRQTMEYVAATAPDDHVEPGDLPPGLAPIAAPAGSAPEPARPAVIGEFRPISEEIRDLERRRMVEALAASGGVRTKAAAMIEMPIRTFTLKLKQYKL